MAFIEFLKGLLTKIQIDIIVINLQSNCLSLTKNGIQQLVYILGADSKDS